MKNDWLKAVLFSIIILAIVLFAIYNVDIDTKGAQMDTQIEELQTETSKDEEQTVIVIESTYEPQTEPETEPQTEPEPETETEPQTQTETEIQFVPPFHLTDSEREYIERVVMAEARGESQEGQMAVAQCILDRAMDKKWHPIAIVREPLQFSDPYYGSEVTLSVKIAVSEVFDKGTRIYEKPIEHFHSPEASPSWAKEHELAGIIGRHFFYYK